MSHDVKSFRTQAINKNLLILKEDFKDTDFPEKLNMELSYQKDLEVDFAYKNWGMVYLSDEDVVSPDWRTRVMATKKYSKPLLLIIRSSSVSNDLINGIQFFAVENDIKTICVLSTKQLIRVITGIIRDKKGKKPLCSEKFNPREKFKRDFRLQSTVLKIPGVDTLYQSRELLQQFHTIQEISQPSSEELKNSVIKNDQNISKLINFFKSNNLNTQGDLIETNL